MSGAVAPGPVSAETMKEKALDLFKALAFFAIVQSTDPKQQKDLERMTELRLEVQEVLDRLAPGWEQ